MNIERILHILSYVIALFVLVIFGGLFFLQRGGPSLLTKAVPLVGEEATGTSGRLIQPIVSFSTAVVVPAREDIPRQAASTSTLVTPTRAPQKIVVTPPPLRIQKIIVPNLPVTDTANESESATSSADGPLNQRDIVRFTNDERAKEELSPLTLNKHLTAIAEAKAVDMIAKQYFAHVSPSGIDVAKMSELYGYPYLNIGENLALGDFVSSREVVTGWMNSPGHRANIMNVNYKEIGVAALVGVYEGRTVWFAVQEFGRPLSDCIEPDALLNQKIAIYEGELIQLEGSLERLKAQIEIPHVSAESYNVMVGDFNTIVTLHNSLLVTTKDAITKYNTEVEKYNACVGAA